MGCSKSSQKPPKTESVVDMAKAEHLIHMEDGARIFYISPEGVVSPPSDPVSLNVAQMSQGDKTMFIHANDWFYPLVPGSSKAYKTDYGAYVFPDVTSEKGGTVGLILPNALKDDKLELEKVLSAQTRYTKEEDLVLSNVDKDKADVITENMHSAATWVSKKVNKGGETADTVLKKQACSIKEKIRQAENKHVVDPRIKEGLIYTKDVTDKSVKVSNHLVERVDKAKQILQKQAEAQLEQKARELGGSQLDPAQTSILNQANQQYPSSSINPKVASILPSAALKKNKKGKTPIDGAIQIATAGAQSFGMVYFSLEDSGKVLANTIALESVDIVRHRYGSEAALIADQSLATAGNVAAVSENVATLGMKQQLKAGTKN